MTYVLLLFDFSLSNKGFPNTEISEIEMSKHPKKRDDALMVERGKLYL